MKKILSVALSTAMAFSMFASVAFGADAKLTPEQQFNALKDAGIVSGFPDGLSHLEKTLTRAELAKIIVNSLSLEPVDATSYNDKNYAKHWGRTYIEAATQAGILNGKDAAKKLFDPNGAVTVQELAKVLVTALKLEVPADANNTASAWAKGYVAAAVNAGYLADGINYQAQATRSQAVVAAYAIYEAAQVPTVKSYKVVDSKNVEFTLSNDEVVKVTLEKALEANKETEVTFKTAAGEEIKTKITWVVTAATKVESVSADNLKQITVKFDGEVEKASAEDTKNYKFTREIKTAELSADGRSVLLTLDGEYFTDASKRLENQKETKITIDGVRSSDKVKTFKQEVKFTPIDVTTPSVKEVTGLGTKAFKVVFSEPVDRATAIASSNYKIDGKSIAATVEYSFPNTVIVSTELATGSHKLTVSNVKDFADFKVVPLENEFTVAEDTEAPTVVSAKSTDLLKVEIEFNEPLKSIGKVYNGVSSVTPKTVTRSGNKVTAVFDRDKALSYNENTIVIENATDYSNNSATRQVKVTPTLDTERPEVSSVTSDVVGGNTVIKVKYSESVNDTAKKGSNYVVKNKDGKVVTGTGLDSAGHPVRTITLNADNNEATITLTGKLAAGTYTLEVSGVQDNAYVANTILPVSQSFEVGDKSEPTVSKFWVDTTVESPATGVNRDVEFYVTFSKAMATEGTGSVLENTKYNIDWTGGGSYEALPTDATVEMITPETVKITVPYTNKAVSKANAKLRVTLVADQAGNFLGSTAGYVVKDVPTKYDLIKVTEVKASANNQIAVKFDGKLTSIDANDFKVTVTGATYLVTLDSYSYDGGKTIVKFNLADDKKLAANPADVAATFALNKLPADINTQDIFGVKVDAVAALVGAVKDEIKAESVDAADGKKFVLTTTGANSYRAVIAFNEKIKAVSGTDAVTVTLSSAAELDTVTYSAGGTDNFLIVDFTTKAPLVAGDVVQVQLSGNESTKVVTDLANNSVSEFTRSVVMP